MPRKQQSFHWDLHSHLYEATGRGNLNALCSIAALVWRFVGASGSPRTWSRAPGYLVGVTPQPRPVEDWFDGSRHFLAEAGRGHNPVSTWSLGCH